MYLHSTRRRSYLDKHALIGALLFCGTLSTGCPPPPVELPDGMEIEDPGLDPQGLFETQVKTELLNSCSCHAIKQDTVLPFLAPGDEYKSITTYAGGKFLTQMADQSLLLNKGAHQGPAFSQAQKTKVLAWLEGEALARGSGGGSPTTPTVAIRTGDFYISLDSLVQDPLAKITFTLSAFGDRSYRVSNLKLTAGPTAPVHIKHPRFIIFSATGAGADPSDALSTVDLTAPANMTVPISQSGSLLLSNLPATSARLALAFEVIERTGTPGPLPMCKNYAQFNPTVKNRLGACAVQCHAPNAQDLARRSQATGAFNMEAALGSVEADLQKLCVYALGRMNLTNLAQSVLILQPQPQTSGGTPNHPYKFSDAQFTPYSTDLTTWGNGEK